MEERPRHYAARIMELETREQRREALEKVPPHLRDLVKKHVEITYELRKVRRARKDGK